MSETNRPGQADLIKPNEVEKEASIDQFAQDAINNPTQINWDTITQEQRNAIVRACGYEPIDWESMSEDEVQSVRDENMHEFLINPPRYNPDLYGFTEQETKKILRSEILQFGYWADWGNAVLAYYQTERENPTESFEQMSEKPLNGDKYGIQTYTRRFVDSPGVLALARPDLQKSFDELVTGAYNAARSGDKITMQSKLANLATIDRVARQEYKDRVAKIKEKIAGRL